MAIPRVPRETESIDVSGIDIVRWNPPRRLTRRRIGRWLPRFGSTNNFGDMLGPVAASHLAPRSVVAPQRRRLVVVGSIMHFALDGDVVWGAGVNGKVPLDQIRARDLDVRAVRGPLTATTLRTLGISVPDVFGDPGLLVAKQLGIRRAPEPATGVVSLPNLRDASDWTKRDGYVNPCAPYREVIEAIAGAERVVTSSLHGLIIAESIGVPVSLVKSREEPSFKYEDYFEGTGRGLSVLHASYEAAYDARPTDPLVWDEAALVASFPDDLWRGTDHAV
jgi:pyruvyltransferase